MPVSRVEGAVQFAVSIGRKDRMTAPGAEPYPMNRYLLTEQALLAAGFTRAEIIAMTEAEYTYAHGSVQSGYAHGWEGGAA
jgi:hypothetical protein